MTYTTIAERDEIKEKAVRDKEYKYLGEWLGLWKEWTG